MLGWSGPTTRTREFAMFQSIAAFSAAAALLTITPGLDTALVLRTATLEGWWRAALAASGIIVGVLVWGVIVGLGLGVLLLTSALAFSVLKWIGALYLVALGLRLILQPRDTDPGAEGAACLRSEPASSAWLRGLLSNLLNPKVGLFYVSFLPQFIPQGVSAGSFSVLLAAIHAALSVIWFAVLIAATAPIAKAMRRPGVLRWLDRAIGGLFVSFGVRLALSTRD